MWYFPRHVIIASAVLAVALAAWGIWRPQPPRQQQADEYSYEGGDVPHPEIAKPSAEVRIADYTMWLAIFTAAMVFAIFRQISWMKRTDGRLGEQIQLARDEFNAEHRPWLSVAVVPAADFKYMPDGTAFTVFSFTLHNSGRTPALHVWVNCEVVPSGINPIPVQLMLADQMKTRIVNESAVGLRIFPATAEALSLTHNVSPTLVVDWRKRMAAHPDSARNNPTHIVGCVSYRAPFGETVYQTGFVREFYRVKHPAPALLPIDPNEWDISQIDLFLRPSVFGNGLTT